MITKSQRNINIILKKEISKHTRRIRNKQSYIDQILKCQNFKIVLEQFNLLISPTLDKELHQNNQLALDIEHALYIFLPDITLNRQIILEENNDCLHSKNTNKKALTACLNFWTKIDRETRNIVTMYSNAINNLYLKRYTEEVVKLQKQQSKQWQYILFRPNILALEAYNQIVKTLLIGGMASGSRPYAKAYTEETQDPQLKAAISSLRKKHNPKFKNLKQRYTFVHDQHQSLRTAYSGANNVHRGFIYSKSRIEKYLERKNMLEAILYGIQSTLVTTNNDIHFMQKISLDNFIQQINQLSSLQFMPITTQCVHTLIIAFMQLLNTNQINHNNIASLLLNTVAMIEIAKILQKTTTEPSLSIDDYYKIMAMLNLMIMDQLNSTPLIRKNECFFQNMIPKQTGTFVSNTLVDDNGTDALQRAARVIGITFDLNNVFPGVPLPNAIPNENPVHGYFEWVDPDIKITDQSCILIGRTSETLYDINDPVLNNTTNIIQQWVHSNPNNTNKTLIVDISITAITKIDPILSHVLRLRTQLNDLFDIIVVRSEQKQQSLGLGKFAAGAGILITNNINRLMDFNQEANKPLTPDQALATFYRENAADAVIALVKEQSKNATQFMQDHAAQLNGDCIASGPFILCAQCNDLNTLKSIPKGHSFGFLVRTRTSWEEDQYRIDPGLTPI